MYLDSALMAILNFIFKVIPRQKPSKDLLKSAKIIAHRGDNKHFTENTLLAFKSCADHNIYGIEFDVQWTCDLQPIIFHDRNAGRVFNQPNLTLHKMTLNEVREKLPQIPTLEEVIHTFTGQLHFMIELKTLHQASEKNLQEMSQKLQLILSKLTPGKDYHILSLHPSNFKIASFVPSKHFCIVAEKNKNEAIQWAQKHHYGYLFGHYALITNKTIKRLKTLHLAYSTGFVNSKNVAFREILRGTTWLFSDNAIALKNELKP